jgi:hypothetical protein
MQIHELKLHTVQEAQLTEVDLVGPNSVFNVGREVLKDPRAFVSSRALGAAQQRAANQYAASRAPAVTNIANTNIPQTAKSLAAGWRQIGAQLPSPLPSPTTVQPKQPSAQPTITPATKIQGTKPGQPSAADYENLERRLQAQLAKQQKDQQSSDKPPYAEELWGKPSKYDNLKEDAASDYRDSFIQYARRVLNATDRGVDTEMIARDENTNSQLDALLKRIIALHNQPDQQTAEVEKYFNTALTAWNKIQTNPALYQRLNPQGTAAGGRGRQTTVQTGDAEQELQQMLSQIGISKAQLQKLAQTATDAAGGRNFVRSTGNPVIDSVLQAAGMRFTR